MAPRASSHKMHHRHLAFAGKRPDSSPFPLQHWCTCPPPLLVISSFQSSLPEYTVSLVHRSSLPASCLCHWTNVVKGIQPYPTLCATCPCRIFAHRLCSTPETILAHLFTPTLPVFSLLLGFLLAYTFIQGRAPTLNFSYDTRFAYIAACLLCPNYQLVL